MQLHTKLCDECDFKGLSDDEIKEMGISAVKKSRKQDSNIIYITLKDTETASNIFKRTGILKNDNVHVTSFIPPQIFERFRSLQ